MSKIRLALLATTILLVGGFAGTASFAGSVGATPDFSVTETVDSFSSCDVNSAFGTCGYGHFELFNNTTDYSVTGFDVGNFSASSAATSVPGWSATTGSVDYGSGPESSFIYTANTPADALGNGDYNPEGTDFLFTIFNGAPSSPFEIFANGPNGPTSCIGNTGSSGCDPAPAPVPEPRGLLLLGLGLAGLVWSQRRRLASGRQDT
jgi:hypothetical protein